MLDLYDKAITVNSFCCFCFVNHSCTLYIPDFLLLLPFFFFLLW